MVDMIATKRLKYGTRRLSAGEPFEARHDRDARLLIGIGKARYATRMMVADDAVIPTEELVRELQEIGKELFAETDPRPALRAEYEAKFGKRAFPGWSADVLREKLAAG